jgi:hypothetical protein
MVSGAETETTADEGTRLARQSALPIPLKPGGHIGYETWHKDYDSAMASVIASFPPGQMTDDDLIFAMPTTIRATTVTT